MNAILLIILAITLIGGVECVKRVYHLPTYISRRITHIGAALVAAVAPLFVSREVLIASCLLFAALMVLLRHTRSLLSLHEIERKSFGDVCLPLGAALSAAIFLPSDIVAYEFGILVMGISDALAGMIGERFGSHRIRFLTHVKSIEGSVAFFASTLIIALGIAPAITYELALIAFFLTVVEFIAVYGLDNLLLPILGGLLIQLIR